MREWILLVSSLALACGAPEAEPEPEVEVEVACVAIERGALEDTRELFGLIDTTLGGRASVAPEVPGRVLALSVHEGDVVERGALLAEIDDAAAFDAAHAAGAHVTESELAAENARATRDRAERLVSRGIAARHELEDAEARLGELEAARDAARALRRGSARIASRGRVTAPISGVVVHVFRHVGDTVDGTPATPIVELADVHALELSATAAPRDLLAIALAQRADVVVDGLEAPLAGAVSRVAPALDPLTGTGGIRIALPEGTRLPLGLTARAVIHVGAREGLVVPVEAVRGRRDGGAEVLRCVEGSTVAVEVTLGLHVGGLQEIAGELAEGDRVVARSLGIDEGTASREDAP